MRRLACIPDFQGNPRLSYLTRPHRVGHQSPVLSTFLHPLRVPSRTQVALLSQHFPVLPSSLSNQGLKVCRWYPPSLRARNPRHRPRRRRRLHPARPPLPTHQRVQQPPNQPQDVWTSRRSVSPQSGSCPPGRGGAGPGLAVPMSTLSSWTLKNENVSLYPLNPSVFKPVLRILSGLRRNVWSPSPRQVHAFRM